MAPILTLNLNPHEEGQHEGAWQYLKVHVLPEHSPRQLLSSRSDIQAPRTQFDGWVKEGNAW